MAKLRIHQKADIPQPFDDKAHQIVGAMLEAVMQKMDGRCDPEFELTWDYIERCESYASHTLFYSEFDRMHASQSLLGSMRPAVPANIRARYDRYHRQCALQLSWYSSVYFAEFHPILRMVTLAVLASAPTLQHLKWSGILRLALAELPNIEIDIRREIRRRGGQFEPNFILNETKYRRIEHYKKSKINNELIEW